MLPLAQLGENTGFLALFLEATDGALDGLVLLDPNPCHALHSPPLRAPAAATVPRRWMSGEGTIKQKPWSVKVGSRTSARRRRTSGRKLQESLREIGEDAVDACRHQAVEFGLRIHLHARTASPAARAAATAGGVAASLRRCKALALTRSARRIAWGTGSCSQRTASVADGARARSRSRARPAKDEKTTRCPAPARSTTARAPAS